MCDQLRVFLLTESMRQVMEHRFSDAPNSGTTCSQQMNVSETPMQAEEEMLETSSGMKLLL